jgi:NAD(P)-dependent dehydrogenase (short-subunit alcohol dehydrogenase family)
VPKDKKMNHNRQGKYESPVRAILTGLADMFQQKNKVGTVQEEDRLDGKNVLITGASSGLGYAISLELAKKGAHVHMVCRSGIPEKGEEIKKKSGSSGVTMFQVDLSDLDSIGNLANRIEKSRVNFDVVICNAAMVPRQSRQTAWGLEEMFLVNYLAKYLMVRKLLEKGCLRTNGDRSARIIFVASESHRNAEKFDWENFGRYQPYGIGKTVERYGYYKLLLVTFARELSRRLNGTGISVFALCPGPVNSRIAREAPWLVQPLLKLVFKLFFRSPVKAAEPVLYFATSPDVSNMSYDYLHLMSRKEIDPKAEDPVNGRELWRLSEKILEENGIRFGKDQ